MARYKKDRNLFGLNMVIDVDPGQTELLLAGLHQRLDPFFMAKFLYGYMGPRLRERGTFYFGKERAPSGESWAPLAPATQQIRADQLGQARAAHPINVRSGELERYITQSPGTLRTTGGDAIFHFPSERGAPAGELGKKVRGAQKGEGTAPPRPVLGLTEDDLAFLLVGLYGVFQTPMSTGSLRFRDGV